MLIDSVLILDSQVLEMDCLEMDYNESIMSRRLWCRNCKGIWYSNKLAPNCSICKIPLVTVVYSIITNLIITGSTDTVNYESLKRIKISNFYEQEG